jgi:hypothetical protein
MNSGLGEAHRDPGDVLLRLVTQSAARAEMYARLLQEAFDAAEGLKEAYERGTILRHSAPRTPTLLRQHVVILSASSIPAAWQPLSAIPTEQPRRSVSMSPARRSEALLILKRRSVSAVRTSHQRPLPPVWQSAPYECPNVRAT